MLNCCLTSKPRCYLLMLSSYMISAGVWLHSLFFLLYEASQNSPLKSSLFSCPNTKQRLLWNHCGETQVNINLQVQSAVLLLTPNWFRAAKHFILYSRLVVTSGNQGGGGGGGEGNNLLLLHQLLLVLLRLLSAHLRGCHGAADSPPSTLPKQWLTVVLLADGRSSRHSLL